MLAAPAYRSILVADGADYGRVLFLDGLLQSSAIDKLVHNALIGTEHWLVGYGARTAERNWRKALRPMGMADENGGSVEGRWQYGSALAGW
jgi:hypothetical protein